MNQRVPRVVLVGNPNVGKSTLFSALSGLTVRTANFPGVTIEKKIGRLANSTCPIDLIDLPGTYSLSPRSPDELVAIEVLTGELPGQSRPDAIVCVVDATRLQRNLFLVSQLLELGRPLIVALNMIDAAQARAIQIDIPRLSQQLGAPVFAVSASKHQGIDSLRDGIVAVAQQPPVVEPIRVLPAEFYRHREAFEQQLHQLASTADGGHAANGHRATANGNWSTSSGPPLSRYLTERAILDRGGEAERQLIQRLPAAAAGLIQTRQQIEAELGSVADMECDYRHRWAEQKTAGTIQATAATSHTATDRIDSILLHRVWGTLFLIALMFLIFQSIYAGSGWPMAVIELAQAAITGWVESWLAPGALRSLITDGVIAGVGGVVIFLPQIAYLFFFIAVLEDCGYMARIAFLVDRVMSWFGLGGKSFLPLMSSYACAIPGVMATRVIENRRDRFATIMVAPLMSCSARLPVYLLMIAAFVPPTQYLAGLLSLQGMVLMAMYLIGAAVAIPTAWLLKKTALRGETAPFVLELPDYKLPGLLVVLRRVWDACQAFLVRAGTVIFTASILIWATAYWPSDRARSHQLQALIEQADDNDVPEQQIRQWQVELNQQQAVAMERSYLGRVGHAIEPVVRPLGWDWKIGVGALASFPAREVIIATLGTIYSLGGDVDEANEGLIAALQQATWPDGRPVYNVPVALSIMVFFALCAQCVSTLAVIRRETNSWRWPFFSFTYMTALAYLAALLVYQVSIRIIA